MPSASATCAAAAVPVAGEHDGGADAGALQGGDGLGRVGLDYVGDDDVPGVFAVDGHMDDGPGWLMAFDRFNTQMTHEAAVAGGDLFSVDFHDDAVAADLLHLADAAHIQGLSPGLSDAHGNGVGGCALGQRGIFQHGFPVQFAVVDIRGHLKDAHGQGAGFVKDHGVRSWPAPPDSWNP